MVKSKQSIRNKVKKKECIQHHHPDYMDHPDYKIPIYRGEHWMITRLDRKFRLSKHKPFSKGFLRALAWFERLYWNKGVDINGFFENEK